MRIGIVTEYYRPWPGGISEHVHHEAVELRARGHQVRIVTGPATAGWRDTEDVVRIGGAFEFTSNGALSRMVLGRELLGMRRFLRRQGFDVVHVHAPLDPCLALAAVRGAECPVVGTFHANFTPSLLWDTLFGRLKAITGPAWARLGGRIAVSEEAKRSIAHYFPEARPGDYTIIPNGVDCERFDPAAPPIAHLDDARPTLLFVGRADPRKGLPLLLRAFPEIRRRVPGARLLVVGVEGEEVAPIVREIGAEAAADVVFAGYVAPEEMAGYFASCDVFCSPATGQESQGIVLLEAMAAGRPPVAFDIPGYRDVVRHDVDGWLVDEVGEAPLAAALSSLLRDELALKRLGEAGRATALGYAWPRVVERIEGVFLAALEGA